MYVIQKIINHFDFITIYIHTILMRINFAKSSFLLFFPYPNTDGLYPPQKRKENKLVQPDRKINY